MEEALVHSEHETSVWPMVVGASILLSALSLLSFFHWQVPILGIVLGGAMLAILAVGLAGWAREAFQHAPEEIEVGTVAVAAFVISETIIFGTVFVAFWVGRIDNFDVWDTFVPAGLEVSFAVWLTFILWASSVTIVLSERAFTRGDKKNAMIYLGATLGLGLLFVVLHMNEWRHLIGEGFTVDANVYATAFYSLTGVHTSHVIVGLGINLVLFWVVASGLMTTDRTTLYKGAGLYWHFVDIMWLLVAANAYLIGGAS
jgi:cytochrome c oxidase subunit 3